MVKVIYAQRINHLSYKAATLKLGDKLVDCK